MDILRILRRQDDESTTDPDSGSGGGVSGNSSASALLDLVADPFSTELQSTSFYASLAWTFGLTALIFALFCVLRPRTNAVYAPRAKHADEKHAPPAIDRGLFSWVGPIKNVKENEMVERLGLDAVVFLRFLRMLRDMFLALSVVGLGVLLPVILSGKHYGSQYRKVSFFMKFTPQYKVGGSAFWAFTVVAYIFNIIVCGFIWWNYRAILRLRRIYFQSRDYQSALHSRTLMITHVPQSSRTDEGIARLAEQAKSTEDVPKTAVGRNARDLPDLIEEHEKTVRKLEKYLAKYLKDPNHIPANRPTCKPAKKDKAHTGEKQVDAIDYLTGRVRELELEIKETRESVDRRNPMPYGFASYTHIEDAHAVAFAARSKGPEGTTIRLAPKPHDIIWKNLGMSRKMRNTKSFWNGVWMTILTLLFIVPNVLTAVFLSDLNNLGQVWKGFQHTLQKHQTVWGIVQGILAPAVQGLFYLVLPSIFRRLFHNSGDPTKTSRERHVTNRLFAFYVFNQLIVFSLFAAVWRFIAGVIAAHRQNENALKAIRDNHVFSHIVTGLCNTTPYWMTWQIQHNLGVAVDLLQIWPLVKGTLMRKYGHPTPRETIELSAPPPFEYADYYNNYLFTATVGFCFACYQPLILPVTALYIALEAWTKKYLLQYVFITKTESGGVFWRILINRLLIGLLLADALIAILVGAQGVILASAATTAAAAMLYALIPLPFLLYGFKLYCQKVFDPKIGYFTTKPHSDLEVERGADTKHHKRNDRVGVRFGNPALYKQLMTPLVAAKSQHLLKEIYSGRLDQDMAGARAGQGVYGYSDVYMSRMSHERPGKTEESGAAAPFEIVPESEMDFENFKKREEFRDQFGGTGTLYGRDDDQSKKGSRQGSVATMSTMMGMAGAGRARSESPTSESRGSSRTRVNEYASESDIGTTYAKGYQMPSSRGGYRSDSPSRFADPRYMHSSTDVATAGHPAFRNGSGAHGYSDSASVRSGAALRNHAASMGQSGAPAAQGRYTDQPRGQPGQQQLGTYDAYRTGSGGSSRAGIPHETDEDTSYDYFRRGGGRR